MDSKCANHACLENCIKSEIRRNLPVPTNIYAPGMKEKANLNVPAMSTKWPIYACA